MNDLTAEMTAREILERGLPLVDFAGFLRREREARGQTAQDVYETLQVCKSFWGKVETGYLALSPALLLHLAAFWGWSPETIVREMHAYRTCPIAHWNQDRGLDGTMYCAHCCNGGCENPPDIQKIHHFANWILENQDLQHYHDETEG